MFPLQAHNVGFWRRVQGTSSFIIMMWLFCDVFWLKGPDKVLAGVQVWSHEGMRDLYGNKVFFSFFSNLPGPDRFELSDASWERKPWSRSYPWQQGSARAHPHAHLCLWEDLKLILSQTRQQHFEDLSGTKCPYSADAICPCTWGAVHSPVDWQLWQPDSWSP